MHVHNPRWKGTLVVSNIDRQAVSLVLMSMTAELTETATAVQSLPSLLYAAMLLLLLFF